MSEVRIMFETDSTYSAGKSRVSTGGSSSTKDITVTGSLALKVVFSVRPWTNNLAVTSRK